MKRLFAVCCLPFIFLISGCGSSSPKVVLAKFLNAMERGDVEEAKKYATADSQGFLDMIGKGNEGAADAYKNHDLIVTDNVTVKDDEAKVEVRASFGERGINFRLRREKGQWKVKFNVGSVINTAIDLLQNAGTEVHKEVDRAVDSLQDAIEDSLH